MSFNSDVAEASQPDPQVVIENLRRRVEGLEGERDRLVKTRQDDIAERERTIGKLQRLLNEAEGERDRLKAARPEPQHQRDMEALRRQLSDFRAQAGRTDEQLIGALATCAELTKRAEKAEAEVASYHSRLVESQNKWDRAENNAAKAAVQAEGLKARIAELEAVIDRIDEDRARLEREHSREDTDLSVQAALTEGLKEEVQRQAESLLRLISQLVDARAERDHWRDELRALQRLDDGRRRMMDAMDDLIIDISDGQLMRTPSLQALPPWRAAMMARLGEKANVALHHGTVEQLVAEARKVGGDGVLGDWWLR